jgi:hypothetical protein
MLALELSFTEGKKKVNLEIRFSSSVETNASKTTTTTKSLIPNKLG